MGVALPSPRTRERSDLVLDSIRARCVVMFAWRKSLGPLTLERGRDPESQAVLSALQFGSRPPKHSCDSNPDLLEKLKGVLRAQIQIILENAELDDPAGHFYAQLREDLERANPGDPIRELLDLVCEKAASVYRGDWIAPLQRTVFLGDHPHRYAEARTDPYTATGQTIVSGKGSSEVQVKIFAGHFGPEAFCSLPVIMTHECVAHVPARPREQSDDPGLFNEGFMDWAALVLFRQWCGELAPEFAAAARRHGDALHDKTLNSEKLRTVRGTAHTKANDVVYWWRRRTDFEVTESDAQWRLAMLAVKVNVEENMTWQEKDHLVTALSPESRPAMAGALEEFLSDPSRDIARVVEAARTRSEYSPGQREATL
jgi:hypothetical protein